MMLPAFLLIVIYGGFPMFIIAQPDNRVCQINKSAVETHFQPATDFQVVCFNTMAQMPGGRRPLD